MTIYQGCYETSFKKTLEYTRCGVMMPKYIMEKFEFLFYKIKTRKELFFVQTTFISSSFIVFFHFNVQYKVIIHHYL